MYFLKCVSILEDAWLARADDLCVLYTKCIVLAKLSKIKSTNFCIKSWAKIWFENINGICTLTYIWYQNL